MTGIKRESKFFLFCFWLLWSICVTDSFAQGFDERYEAWQLTNGDIYIKQNPDIVLLHGDVITPIVLPLPVEEFVLHPQGEGYSTSSDTSGIDLSGAVEIGVVLGDFNVDGLLDIILKDIGTNIFDQIVFAEASGIPQVVTAVDEDFKQFFEEVYGWMLDENYIDNKAKTTKQVNTSSAVWKGFASDYAGALFVRAYARPPPDGFVR